VAPTASPSSTPSPTLTTDADGVRHREAGPFIELDALSQLQGVCSEYRHYPGSNGPGSEKPSIDSTFA